MSGDPRIGIRKKKEEQLVAAYLRHRGNMGVHYEPDAIMPPDFVVDTRNAVDVRRLNQNYGDGNDTQGLEEIAIPSGEMCERSSLRSALPRMTRVGLSATSFRGLCPIGEPCVRSLGTF
jgi:hypothetical protein